MGIRPKLWQYERNVLMGKNLSYMGLKWLEMGAQEDRRTHDSAKNSYCSLGVNHTSIDITGDFQSSILDLDFPLPEEMYGQFDVVTNYGTSEHVNNQYSFFKNVHDCCKIGGMMIHGVPKAGTFKKHCRYYYTVEFFVEFAQKAGYDFSDVNILDFSAKRHKRHLLCITFKKLDSNDFISEEEFGMLPLHDSGDMRATGNYIIERRESRKKPKK